MNARDKGKRGERLWRDELNNAGFIGSSRCGQQGNGGGVDNPDVICPLLSDWHFEVKFTQKLQLQKAIKQATEDARGKRKIAVASKRKNEPWLITINAKDFLELLKYKQNSYKTNEQENETRTDT